MRKEIGNRAKPGSLDHIRQNFDQAFGERIAVDWRRAGDCQPRHGETGKACLQACRVFCRIVGVRVHRERNLHAEAAQDQKEGNMLAMFTAPGVVFVSVMGFLVFDWLQGGE
jgi:hypothetical protein